MEKHQYKLATTHEDYRNLQIQGTSNICKIHSVGNYIASKEDYSKHKHIDNMGEIKIPAITKANNQSSLSFFLLFYLFI